jgi:VIT1/CCC1 family predicted Fe2+/Mn2+ transporter
LLSKYGAFVCRTTILSSMQTTEKHDPKLAELLILDELFDLTLYKELNALTRGKYTALFDQLIPIETKHVHAWQTFFGNRIERLDVSRRIKLFVLVSVCRIFGESAMHLILEAIEVRGVRKYVRIWKEYQHTTLGDAVHEILEDELRHEDMLVAGVIDQQISPQSIQSIFLGFNDGLTEMLGAVAGFFAAFQSIAPILIASLTVTAAGAFSMAAGAYVGASSSNEIEATENGKREFLHQRQHTDTVVHPLQAAFLVGFSYLLGALIPLLPVFAGARSIFISIIVGICFVILVSTILSFLSGMNILRRIATNIFIIALAVLVTYLIGTVVKILFGISVT